MKGRIYKVEPLEPLDAGDIYIGSTTGYLCKRFYIHKYNYNHNIKKYCIFNLFNKYGGCDGFKITLLEEIEFNDKRELLELEAKYIKTLECVNINIPKTKEEIIKYVYEYNIKYYLKNKDNISEQKKKYYQLNKDKIKEKRIKDNKPKQKKIKEKKITKDKIIIDEPIKNIIVKL
jgi:hypothetical protein